VDLVNASGGVSSGCSAAWSARRVRDAEAGGSNPSTLTRGSRVVGPGTSRPGLARGEKPPFGSWRSLASAPGWGSGGRRFESCWADEVTPGYRVRVSAPALGAGRQSPSLCIPTRCWWPPAVGSAGIIPMLRLGDNGSAVTSPRASWRRAGYRPNRGRVIPGALAQWSLLATLSLCVREASPVYRPPG
jgi:hypothetical protein